MKTLIDSNILIYAYNLDSPFQKRAEEIIEDIYQGEINAYVADINLIEFYSVITDGRKVERPLSPEDASNILEHILKSDKFKKIYTSKEIIAQLPELLKEVQVRRYNIYEHILYLLMKGNNINSVITANEEDFKKFPFIKIETPFTDIIKPLRREVKRDSIMPYGHQWLDDSDIEEVIKVLKSDWLTQGPKVKEFESALAHYCGAKYAVAFSSGTAALHGAYFVAGISKGDEIITSPITFAATSNAALFLGAKPVFSEIEEETANIDVNLIREKITQKTKAIVPVHFAGQPVDMDELLAIAKKDGLFVIEDACHALGSTYKRRKVGSLSDLTVFSFHPVKNITTGEGGAVLTNQEDLYEKLMMFRHHGITKNPEKFVNNESAFSHHASRLTPRANPWYYEMHYLGSNYRLTDFQCALGLSQLKKLDDFVTKRREIVNQYNQAFKEVEEIEPLTEKPDRFSAWHIYVIKLRLEKLKKTRREIFDYLRNKGIGVQVHYLPVYWHPYYQRLGYRNGLCPTAEDYYERAITLPLYPSISDSEIRWVIDTFKESIRGKYY